METIIFKTNDLAEKILHQAQETAKKLPTKPGLAVVLVGDDPASIIYVKKKAETCRQYGLAAQDITISPADGFAKLEQTIQQLNKDPKIHGILVQSPLPMGWDEKKVQKLIQPTKDVDGFHPENAGALAIDAKRVLEEGLPPCTPAGVMEILHAARIPVAGKHAVIVGRSNIVGKPMALMLLAADATVTIAHSKTKNLDELCRQADLIVAAIGKPKFITKDFLKPGVILVDVGINRKQGNIVVGDIDNKNARGIAQFLTPVPNGVGPMTIAMLIRNTVRAAANAQQ